MADHPAFTLAGLLTAGGSMGYWRTRSKASLIAGLGLGASFAFAGYLIRGNKDYGTELALGNSVALLGAGSHRIVKTGAKSPLPLGLGVAGGLATWYYQRKVREFRYGV